MIERETKSIAGISVKAMSKEGTFEGILSPYGNVDSGGDIVEQGAYSRTLREKGNTRVMLWQHKSDTPIGKLHLEDRASGLWAKGELLMSLPAAKIAYDCVKAGLCQGLSIGFTAERKKFDA